MSFRSLSSLAPLRSSHTSLRRLPKSIKSILNGPLPSAVDPPSANVRGWVKHIRKHRHIAFVTITDGTSIEPLQVVTTPERLDESVTQ
jgi:aspartyl/asparaginyl-tRNA synthetase